MKFIKKAHKRISYNVIRFAFSCDGLTPGIFTFRDEKFYPVWIDGNVLTHPILHGSFYLPDGFSPSHISGLSFSPPITVDDGQYFLVEIEDNGAAHIMDMVDVRKLHANMVCSYDENRLSLSIIDSPLNTNMRFIIGVGRPLYTHNSYFINDVFEKVIDQNIYGNGKYTFDVERIPEGYTAYLMIYDSIKEKFYITNTYRFGISKESASPVLLNIFQINNGIALNFNTPVFPLYIYRSDDGIGVFKTIGVSYDTHIYIDLPYGEGHYIYKVGYVLNGNVVYSNELGIKFSYCEGLDSPNVNVLTLEEGDFYMDITRILQPVTMKYGITRTATGIYTDTDEHEVKADASGSALSNRVGFFIINRTSDDVYIYSDRSLTSPETHGIVLNSGEDLFLQVEESTWYFKAASSTGHGVTIIEVG